MPECQTVWHPISPVPDWKKLTMLGLVRYRTSPRQSGIFLVWYGTGIIDAGMPMPALVSLMLMPSYGVINKRRKSNPMYLSCDIHKARAWISNTPSHMYQQTEHLKLSKRCLGTVRLKWPGVPYVLESPPWHTPSLPPSQQGNGDCIQLRGTDVQRVFYSAQPRVGSCEVRLVLRSYCSWK